MEWIEYICDVECVDDTLALHIHSSMSKEI